MRRRALLAITAGLSASALAGCSALDFGRAGTPAEARPLSTASLDMTVVTDAEIADRVVGGVGNRAPLLDEILDGGATVTSIDPPFPADEHVQYDDEVYRLDREVTDEVPATRYVVEIGVAEGTADQAETVRFADLPAVDRRKLGTVVPENGESSGVVTEVLYRHGERERSVFVPEPEYEQVALNDGRRVEWSVEGTEETVMLTYEYTAERVNTVEEYGRRVRAKQAFALGDLSDAQRRIVEAAVADEYLVEPEGEPTPALASLVDRFRGQEQAHALDDFASDGLNGQYLVRFDADVHWTNLVVASAGD